MTHLGSPSLFESSHPIDLQTQLSVTETVAPKSENEKNIVAPPINDETKQQGAITWHVYLSYLRAGVGVFLGFVLVSLVFLMREIMAIFSDRWLARWNDEESHRYGDLSQNCSNTIYKNIGSMNDVDWNNYRNQRFYIYCGMHIY